MFGVTNVLSPLIWVLIIVGLMIGVGVLLHFAIRLDWAITRGLNKKFSYEVDPRKPMTKTLGKLVRKVKDDKSVQQATTSMRNYQRLNFNENPNIIRYYLTFETKKGYKSFTVTKEVFAKYRLNTYGYIVHQKSKFDHFEVHSKTTLGL